jgi:hypothetical protein
MIIIVNMQCSALNINEIRCKNIAYSGSCCHIHASDVNHECPICLKVIFNKYIIQCGHLFHKICIENWLKLNNSCPVCRQVISITIPRSIQKELRHFSHKHEFESIIDIAIGSGLNEHIFKKNMRQIGF